MVAASYTEFKKNMKAYMDRVNDDVDHIVITRQGAASNAVLVSEEEWDSLQETLYIISDQHIMDGLKQSACDREQEHTFSFDSLQSFKDAMQR